MARYEVVGGSYTGTGDDVAGRWYIVDTRGDAIDKRGRGWASREEALGALVERLSAWPEPEDLVGVREVAERAGVAAATVHSWRRRHGDFPEPVVVLSTGPVWRWPDVEAWAGTLRQGRPRRG